jgi:hypothetical protein
MLKSLGKDGKVIGMRHYVDTAKHIAAHRSERVDR